MSLVDRYVLSRFDEGGVLVDLATGTFFRVNDVGVLVFATAAAKDPQASAQALAARYGLAPDRATADVTAFLEGLAARAPSGGRNPITFRAEAGGFTMLHGGQPQLWLAADGGCAELRATPAPPLDHLQLLIMAAPHLITLQGGHVLHASAVRRHGRVIAFLGGSGAGKTTTAGLAGNVVAEDLVLLSPDDRVATGGEAALRAWAAAHVGAASSDASDLVGALAGPTMPLDRVLVLDATRRSGDSLKTQRLAGPEAMLALLENSFAELDDARIWRQVVARCERLARTVEIAAATVPAGLDALAQSLISIR